MNGLNLDDIREKIDCINKKLTVLLTERMQLVDQVAAWKIANNLPVSVPEREKAIIKMVRDLAGDDFDDDVEVVFRAIFAASCAREKRFIDRQKETDV